MKWTQKHMQQGESSGGSSEDQLGRSRRLGAPRRSGRQAREALKEMCFQKESMSQMAIGFGSGNWEILGENGFRGVAGTEAWLHRVEKRTQQFRVP